MVWFYIVSKFISIFIHYWRIEYVDLSCNRLYS